MLAGVRVFVVKEELILVTDFGSLRAGDLVVVKHSAGSGHECHGGGHRGVLIAFEANEPCEYSGELVRTPSWEMIPPSRCAIDDGFDVTAIGPEHVDERRLYRVIIPPTEEARETARPKTVERVR